MQNKEKCIVGKDDTNSNKNCSYFLKDNKRGDFVHLVVVYTFVQNIIDV
jgi:hypothetical protein